MIGDRVHDVVGAQNNRIDSIGVTYGYGSIVELTDANPTHLAHTVDEVGRIVSQQPCIDSTWADRP